MYTSPIKAVSLLRVFRELRGMVNVGSSSTVSITELFVSAELLSTGLPPVGKEHSICVASSVPVLTVSVVIDVVIDVAVDVAWSVSVSVVIVSTTVFSSMIL